MQKFTNEIALLLNVMQLNVHHVLIGLGGLWALHLINAMLGYRLNYLGLYPRRIPGIIGIFTSPFLHGDFNHLFFNSIPLFVLANFILLTGLTSFLWVSGSIVLISGGLTWLFGRQAIHIGASSLISGYWGFLMVDAYQEPTVLTILLALVSLYYFGGIFFDIFPTERQVSWEGHLFGLISGIGTYFIL